MNVDEPGMIDDIDGLLESFIRLAGKSDDDIGRKRRPVERHMQAIHQAQEIITRVLAIHFPQDHV